MVIYITLVYIRVDVSYTLRFFILERTFEKHLFGTVMSTYLRVNVQKKHLLKRDVFGM